jgi:glutamyl-tRNA synthetase
MTLDEKKLRPFIAQLALENAQTYGGKANPKALIGRVIPEFPEAKSEMKDLMRILNEVVSEINALVPEEQRKKLLELNPDFFEKKEVKEVKSKDELPELPGYDGEPLRLRFPPAPSGHLHIGHLYGIVFNYEYVKKYGGAFILRIEDTNPENISLANYDAIIQDMQWVCEGTIKEIYYQSDRVERYYQYLEKLLKKGHAYVCSCESEEFKELITASKPCPHREKSSLEQLEEYKKMFNGTYKEGEVVIRFKADLENKNPALRDFSIARINSNEHIRVGKKYKVWPMYNLATAIDDALMEISYVIRGKDHEINGIRQDLIKEALDLIKVPYYHYGRFKFEDIELSKTKISAKIEAKEYEGWEDPRVPSIASYRKRGFKAEAFRKMIVRGGLSKRDSRITNEQYHKSLHFFNKELLEKESPRAFFVSNPKKIRISNRDKIKKEEIKFDRHPENKDFGMRTFPIQEEYFIDGEDYSRIQEKEMIRLMHIGNFLVKKKTKEELELEFQSEAFDRALKIKNNIHYVSDLNQTCTVIMEDNTPLEGCCENLWRVKEGKSVQFERFGFVKFDHKEKEKLVFYYTQR